MNGSITNHPPRLTPKTRSLPHVQDVFRGGVQEFGWALLLNGFAGSDTPGCGVGVRIEERKGKEKRTKPAKRIPVSERRPIVHRDGRPIAACLIIIYSIISIIVPAVYLHSQ